MNTENNKIIAEFLGMINEQGYFKISENSFKLLQYTRHESDLHFHTDWTWLMPVVEKIESIREDDFTVRIDRCNCMIVGYRYYPQFHILKQSATKIEAVYNACVEFINWYNQQKY